MTHGVGVNRFSLFTIFPRFHFLCEVERFVFACLVVLREVLLEIENVYNCARWRPQLYLRISFDVTVACWRVHTKKKRGEKVRLLDRVNSFVTASFFLPPLCLVFLLFFFILLRCFRIFWSLIHLRFVLDRNKAVIACFFPSLMLFCLIPQN